MLRKNKKIFVKYRKKVAQNHSSNVEIYLLYIVITGTTSLKGISFIIVNP